MNSKAMFSSKKDDWGTPECVRRLVFQYANGEDKVFDPCPGGSVVGQPLAIADWDGDGLTAEWPKGTVYVNPPYGRSVPHWVQKCISESRSGSDIILLVPSRTETRWFHDAMKDAQATMFWKGRLRFMGAPHDAPFPSAVFYWGEDYGSFHHVFEPHGLIIGRR